MKPNATAPPSTPSSTSTNGRSLPRLMISGLMTLSIVDTTSAPHSSTKSPQPVCPLLISHRPAGTHTSGGPIGTGDRKNVSSPSSGAAWMPAIQKPIAGERRPARARCPRMPSTTPRTVAAATDARCEAALAGDALRGAAQAVGDRVAVAEHEPRDEDRQRELQHRARRTDAPDATANLRIGSTYLRSTLEQLRGVVRHAAPVGDDRRPDQRQLRDPRRRIGRARLEQLPSPLRHQLRVVGDRRADDDERREHQQREQQDHRERRERRRDRASRASARR